MKDKISIDYDEEAEFEEFDENDTFNVMVDDYSFNINDLQNLEALGKENLLKKHFITDEEYNTIFKNYYVEYSKKKDILKVVINIYDFEDYISDELLSFITRFGRSIEIIVNTREEREIIFKQLDDYFKYYGYKGTDDFLCKEYEEYVYRLDDTMFSKNDILEAISVTEGEVYDEPYDLYCEIQEIIKNMKK